DHFLDARRIDAERLQARGNRVQQLAPALLRHRGVESGIDHESAMRAADDPDIIIERLDHVGRIAAEEILRRAPGMARIADRIDLVDVDVHGTVFVRARTSAPAHCSTHFTTVVKSASGPCCVLASWNSCRTMLPTHIGRPMPSASSRQSFTSLYM